MKKDNIEDIYSELETFSKEPPKELWDNIEARLQQKNKRGGILFLWSSIAVVLVVFLGYMITNSSNNSNLKPIKEISDIEQPIDNNEINKSKQQTTEIVDEAIINNKIEDSFSKNQNIKKEELLNKSQNQNQLSDSNTLNEKEQKDKHYKEQKEEKKRNHINKRIEEKSIIKKGKESKYNKSYALSNMEEKNKGVVNNKNATNKDVSINKDVANNKDAINKDVSVLQSKNVNTTNSEKEKALASNDSVSKAKDNTILDMSEELIAVKEEENDITEVAVVAYKKWSVEVLGGISNTTSESSIQNTSFNTIPQNDFVYTLKMGYAVSDRLTIKSGIGKNVLGQKTDSISYTSTDISEFENNFQSIIDNQNISILGSQEFISDATTFQVDISKGNFQQQLEYIQLPLEVSYDLLKKSKFNVSIGAGGNVNFLTNNSAYLNDEKIGESLGVNKTIFGATVNTSISYNLTKTINLFIEPSYNYFQKPIDNNNQNFKNTQFRALFGLRYRF